MPHKGPQWRRLARWAAIVLVSCSALPCISEAAEDSKPAVQNLPEIGRALAVCMQPLPIPDHYQGMRVTVRLGFNARGRPLGPPRFTYITRDASERIKSEYKDAITGALKRCTPLSFSRELGATMAGQPIILRFDEKGLTGVMPGASSAYVAPTPLPSSQMPPAQPVVPLQQPQIGQQPPIWLPGVANPIPTLPHGPETSQDRRSRCMFQSQLYGVPMTNYSQYMGLCTQ